MIIKKYFMKSVNRITKDFKQKELLPLKLVFFVQASTISVLYPYLTIHMRELGINVEEAAIMSAVIPVIGIIMPPLAGMVADKIGNFKLLLAFFSLIGGAAALLLLLVPVGRITVTYPQRITMFLECGEAEAGDGRNQYLNLGFSDDHSCDLGHRLNGSQEFDLDTKVETCGFVCWSTNQSSQLTGDDILRARSYAVQVRHDSGTASYHHLLTEDDVPRPRTKEDGLSRRHQADDQHLTTAIRNAPPSGYFFPENDLSAFKCKELSGESEGKSKARKYVCSVGIPEDGTWNSLPNANKSLKFGSKNLAEESSKPAKFKTEFFDWSGSSEKNLDAVACAETKSTKNISVSVHLRNSKDNADVAETLSLEECKPRCLVSTLRKSACTNLKEEIEFDPRITFWVYLVIRVFIGIIGSTSYAMYEVAVIAILREQKADYGLQRIYASIGGMISSPLSGWLIDYASEGKGYTDFRPAFYLYAGLKTGTSLLMLFINLEFKKAASNVVADAIDVLKNLEIIALLTACFVLGTAWGYIESFLFWFLEDLGGTRSLMGITITVGGIAGIPLLVLSGPIIDKIGHANVLFVGFVFYAIRLVGYSVIYNPYHCLFFEAMESITSSLAITAAVTYAAKLSTTTTDGSVQGLVGGLYFGVGRGAGSLIGGYLMKAFGTRTTYRTFAVFTLVTGVLYYLFNRFYLRKRPQVEGNEICKKEAKTDPEVKIITEKPKSGSKEYGTIQVENNNMRSVKGAETKGCENEVSDGKEEAEGKEEEKKKQEEEEEEVKRESHSNLGYVPDEEKIDEEIKEKED